MLAMHKNMLKRENSSSQKLKSTKKSLNKLRALFKNFIVGRNRFYDQSINSLEVILSALLEMYDSDYHFIVGCSDNCPILDSNIGGTQILFRNLPKISNFGKTLQPSC